MKKTALITKKQEAKSLLYRAETANIPRHQSSTTDFFLPFLPLGYSRKRTT